MGQTGSNISWRKLSAEGLTIVVSILLAFTIDAWWGAAQDHSREEAYLKQLQLDLNWTIENINYFSARADQADLAEAKLARVFYQESTPPRDSLAVWVQQMGWWVVQPQLGSSQALVNTGDLTLIRHDSLRSAIPGYVTVMEQFELFEDLNERRYIDVSNELSRYINTFEVRLEAMTQVERDSLSIANPFTAVPSGDLISIESQDLESRLRDPEVNRLLLEMNEIKASMRFFRGLMLRETNNLLDLVTEAVSD